jgi:OOP family OmpA-OmpF porin
MIRKIAALTLCFIAIVSLAGAQELGIELDGGLQGMRYTLQNGQTKLLPGGSFGVNYTFPLSGGLGLLTGVTAGLYRTQATPQNSLAFSYPQVDDQGSAFLYNVRLTGYKETQRTLAVTIPVLLQYHTDGAGAQWYFDAGGKLFLPANTNSQASAQQLSVSGYYPNYDLVISDLPKHGFGTVDGWKSSTTTQLKPGAALSAGTGLAFGISPGIRLYAGVYVDYGLTALRTGKDSMPLITYGHSGIGNVKTNGEFNTSSAGQPKLLSFGLQVRLTWGARPARHTARRKAQDSVLAGAQFSIQQKDVDQPAQGSAQSTQGAAQPAQGAAQSAQGAVQPAQDSAQSTQGAAQPAQGVQPQARGVVQSKAVPVAPVSAGVPLSDSELVTLQRPVVFGLVGNKDIPETQTLILDDVVSIMQKHPGLRVSVVGYICDDVKEAESSKVGEARARAVARYLERKGIDRRRIDISYDKESEPSTTYDPAANYLNRRVVVSPK